MAKGRLMRGGEKREVRWENVLKAAREVLIPAGTGGSVEIKAGQYLNIVDLEGTQVADFVAFRHDEVHEYVSPSHTRSMLGRITLGIGDHLTTNFRKPLFRITHDDVGAHDILWAACDPQRYSLDFGLHGHRNCRENLLAALEPYGVEAWWLPDPINFFMNTPVTADGSFAVQPARSRPGDRVELLCLADAVVAVSSCPQDQTPINGGYATPLLLRITDAQMPSG